MQADDYVVMGKANDITMKGYQMMTAPHPETLITLEFIIKEKNLDQLEQLALEVSTPGSKNYGQRLSKADINDLTNNAEGKTSTMNFLNSIGASIVDLKSNGHRIYASAPVMVWEKLLKCQFSVYHKDGKPDIVRSLEYSLPIEMTQHISTISNIIDFPTEVIRIRGGPVVRDIGNK
jgi:tripeptidyl-peptidase-1